MQHIPEPDKQNSAFSRPQPTQLKRGKRWDEYEDMLLHDAVKQQGAKNWRAIASHVPGRTPVQCLHRWSKILTPGLVKGHWTAEEDSLLKDWVKANGASRWSECSKMISGRNGKQCRERWNNTLDPNLKKGKWSYSEDLKIIELYNTLGGKWCRMSEYLPGRSENSIKNRFYSNLRKMINLKKKQIDPEKPDNLCQIAGRHEVPMSYDEFISRRTLSIAQSLFISSQPIQVQQVKPDVHPQILCPKAIRFEF
mmetsp:Transcript_33929/g.59140  ORF Transcript_33929/g.59140 Transcript_33929/m.59140 type:complete len:252 (+) Transcript_33929:4732-5487(+)